VAGGRLLVESFILLEPWLALATGSVPFWLVFNTEPSLAAINRYLDSAGPFDEIRMSLFSHGVESVGLPTIDQWRSVLRRAGKIGSFLGVDEQAFPRDFATMARYHQALARVRNRHPRCRPRSPWRTSTPSWTARERGTPSTGSDEGRARSASWPA
jgi:hypothetical protein